MSSLRLLVVAVLALSLISGCILSKTQVGEDPLRCEPADFAGTWVDSEGEKMVVTVRDAAAGHVIATKPDKPEEQPANYYFRSCGDKIIANLQASIDSPYIMLLAEKEKDKLTLYLPNTTAFAKLIEQNILKGEIKKDQYGNIAYCNLEGIPCDILKKILEGEYGKDMFRWSDPGVYKRVKSK